MGFPRGIAASPAARNKSVHPNLLLCALLSFALVSSCGSDDDNTSGIPADLGAAGTPDATAAQESGSTGGGPVLCDGGQRVELVKGRAVTESGVPASGVFGQACLRLAPKGKLLCVEPKKGDEQGRFEIQIPAGSTCVQKVTMRVLVPGGDFGASYCNMPLPLEGKTAEVAEPYILYATRRATDLPPVGEQKDERSVRFEDGLELDVTPYNFFASGESYEGLAARYLEASKPGLCLPEEEGLDGVYAFSPEGDVLDKPFAMRAPNHPSYAEGAKVDLLLLGGLGCTLADGAELEEDEWRSFGTATVTGGLIASDEGSGLPCLNWLGIRAHKEEQ